MRVKKVVMERALVKAKKNSLRFETGDLWVLDVF